MLANSRSHFLLDRRLRFLNPFVSTECSSCHEFGSQFGLQFFIREKHQKLSRIPRRIHDCLFECSRDRPFVASGTGEKGVLTSSWLGAPTHRTAITRTAMVVGGCVRVRECVRACMRACVRACVMCLQYTIIMVRP